MKITAFFATNKKNNDDHDGKDEGSSLIGVERPSVLCSIGYRRVTSEETLVNSRNRSNNDACARKRACADTFSDSLNNNIKRPKVGLSSDVQELVASLEDSPPANLDNTLAKSSIITWRQVLDDSIRSPWFAQLAQFVAIERHSSSPVFPPACDTFQALLQTPLHRVRVVIVGQDPYHGPGQAHGLAFSVRPGQAIPPSLRNIYQELLSDFDLVPPFHPNRHHGPLAVRRNLPSHGHLIRWARQGVLMLNTVLTVRKGEPNSHQKQGWERFTDDVLRAVDQYSRQQRQMQDKQRGGLVFLLWGKPAQTKLHTALHQTQRVTSSTQSTQHTILCSSHPSPLAAHRTNQPFMGSRCFSKCNQALQRMGHEPIDWNVD